MVNKKKNQNFVETFRYAHLKQDEYIKHKEHCLLILIFQDAVELCNPLGSRRTKHKTVMFYITFANLPVQIRSKLSSIKLLSCISDKLLKQYGFQV